MNFWQITGANCLTMLLHLIFFLWMSIILLGRVPNLSARHMLKCSLAALSLIFGLSSLAAVCYLTGFWKLKYDIGSYLWDYFVVLCKIFFLQFLYQTSFRNSCLVTLMIEIVSSLGNFLSRLYNYGSMYNIAILSERQNYLFWTFVVNPVCVFLCCLLIYKSGVGRLYRQWLEQKSLHKGILLLLASFPALTLFIHSMTAPDRHTPKELYVLLFLMLFLLIHLIFVYVSRDYQQKQAIAAQQASIRQQAIYIEKMEHLQAELRRFRHDFKNMTAGMYLTAKEGDLDAVQSFIQEMTEDFNRQVENQLLLINQLANIQIVEVKGLLLEKLSEMQKENISCNLEVFRPFTDTRMRSTDLLRCLGILIDNAIDEVHGREHARIHLMISRQNDCTTFLVKNILYGEVNWKLLGTAGYSTKGEGRGTGLDSYHRIVEKYDFVFSRTAIQDRYFIQELKIQEV